jgi:hypothetical protein
MGRDGAALAPDANSALSMMRQSTRCSQRSQKRPAQLTPAAMIATSISEPVRSASMRALVDGVGPPPRFRQARRRQAGSAV